MTNPTHLAQSAVAAVILIAVLQLSYRAGALTGAGLYGFGAAM